MANISYHGSHNGALVVEKDGEILCVIEFERFMNYKNVGMTQYKVPRYIVISLQEILNWIEKEYGITEFDNCYFSSTDFIGENFEGTHRPFQTNTMSYKYMGPFFPLYHLEDSLTFHHQLLQQVLLLPSLR